MTAFSIPASPWLALGGLALLWFAAGADRARRAAAVTAVALLALFLLLRELPRSLPGERVIGDLWDWSGPLLALAGALAFTARLVATRAFSWREFGLTFAQRAGSVKPALAVAGGALALNYVAMSFSSFRLPSVPAETWLYQATVPGLVEETVFRGLLLALADRAVPPRWNVAGAAIGVGALLVTFAFLALHGLSPGKLAGVLPAALLYLWLRARSGSLLLPIAAHNAWNLSVYAAHL